MQKHKIVGLFSGFLILVVLLLLPTPEGMSPLAQTAAAVTLLMATWWLTEAIPISATELGPLGAFSFIRCARRKKYMYMTAIPLFGIFHGVPCWVQ